jgi:hypothetical protein
MAKDVRAWFGVGGRRGRGRGGGCEGGAATEPDQGMAGEAKAVVPSVRRVEGTCDPVAQIARCVGVRKGTRYAGELALGSSGSTPVPCRRRSGSALSVESCWERRTENTLRSWAPAIRDDR